MAKEDGFFKRLLRDSVMPFAKNIEEIKEEAEEENSSNTWDAKGRKKHKPRMIMSNEDSGYTDESGSPLSDNMPAFKELGKKTVAGTWNFRQMNPKEKKELIDLIMAEHDVVSVNSSG